MIYKYLVRHNIGLPNYIKERVKEAYFAPAALLAKGVPFERPPCFIVGCGHSGTTLIAAKLGNHPECLTIAHETSIFLPAVNSLLCASRVLAEWSYFSQVAGDKVLVEKTPKHVHACKRIKALVPDANIIGVVRNPLDTISSLHKRFDDLNLCVERWLIDNRALINEAKAGRLTIVKFERITRAPEEQFKRICEFVGIPYSEQMLREGHTPFNSLRHRGNMVKRQTQVSGAIQENVGKWRTSLSDNDAKIVIRKTYALAKEFGYDAAMLGLAPQAE